MKKIKWLLVFAMAAMAAQAHEMGTKSHEYGQTLEDIKASFGFVPTFFKVYPKEALPGAWEQFKGIQMNPKTALAGKNKELIGLAVSAQIPCQYCLYAHKAFAKLDGATESEIQEAIAVGALERQWSTVVNGRPISLEEFKAEIDSMVSYSQNPNKEMKMPDSSQPMVLQEVEKAMGSVPTFLKNYPQSGLEGAWGNLRFLMSEHSALPLKVKDLIGLAVSAQTPCSYCVYADTKFAEADGATKQELDEAVAISAITRHWSTVINGNRLDYKEFAKEIDRIVAGAKKKMKEEKK